MGYEIKKYKIDKEVLRNLPVFYGFITFNEMLDKSVERKYYSRSEKFSSSHFPSRENKPLSKIIDFTQLETTTYIRDDN